MPLQYQAAFDWLCIYNKCPSSTSTAHLEFLNLYCGFLPIPMEKCNTLHCLPQPEAHDCLLVGNPEVGNSECINHQDCLP